MSCGCLIFLCVWFICGYVRLGGQPLEGGVQEKEYEQSRCKVKVCEYACV